MAEISVGSIVKCRNREWVVLPSPDEEIFLLRPLAGTEQEVVGIHDRLQKLGLDRIEPAAFPPPDSARSGDHTSIELLFNAARLTLRDGAGPFRSLGHLSVRPRPYQFVPMMMALRLDPVRMLIADDVGIGKTVEALLIARELLSRGEITRICVICPPYLCSQWQKELWNRFRLNAVVIRSGTISQLEREVPSSNRSIFDYYPHTIVSIDYVKSTAHKAQFLAHAPKFVIVDEAHGATSLRGAGANQQQRHELLRDLAADQTRHIMLLTATPHSGVEEGFRSLLRVLRDDLGNTDLNNEKQRIELARHFVQRRRVDVEARWAGEETPFPKRDTDEKSYRLSSHYRKLFDDVYLFSRELVRSGETLGGWKQRIRFWSALALLRCVMSSPAAAEAAITKRLGDTTMGESAGDEQYAPFIFEATDEDPIDAQPAHVLDEGEAELADPEKKKLRSFAKLAASIRGTDADTKLAECVRLVESMLRGGYQAIVWCRYIATSNYVADELSKRLKREFPHVRVLSVTGELPEDEREEKIADLDPERHPHRVLVATDCLSEGINLQDRFNAVLHYDLPWNPNRLEQREGRVDRFGQPSKTVLATLFYGTDNPVDGAVLDVLLRKARAIYSTLGVRVPIPVDSETVIQTVIKRLFGGQTGPSGQMSLFDIAEIQDVHDKWDRAAKEEKLSRTRFAQHAIKPEEVERELKETDAVLADPATARRFLQNASQRLGFRVQSLPNDVLKVTGLERLPEMVRQTLDPGLIEWKVSFSPNPPDGTTSLDRNHPFLQSLAQWIMEQALVGDAESAATRSSAIRTTAVNSRTFLLLCRLRYTIVTPQQPELLAEEVQCFGFVGSPSEKIQWIDPAEALRLLREARPAANLTLPEIQSPIQELLEVWPVIRPQLDPQVLQRANLLEEAHKRVRSAVQMQRRGLSVARHFPPDLLGALVLIPVPKGVQ